jgi:hypothetical protein
LVLEALGIDLVDAEAEEIVNNALKGSDGQA